MKIDLPDEQLPVADLSATVNVDAHPRGLIEIGIVVAGTLDSVDRRASTLAIQQVDKFLARVLPEFNFTFAHIHRPQLSGDGREEPSVLLQQAAEDRDTLHWDFAFVLTASELVGIYSPFCFAALSRPLDAAIFSLSLIDPQTIDPDADEAIRIDRIGTRLSRMMLHALGHLNGLPPTDDPQNLLYRPTLAADFAAMESFNADQLDRQRNSLSEIADQRLEEESSGRPIYPLFVTKATWINRREIFEAIWGARAWEFPLRLSRLTIASVSTVAVLLMTAEAWDLGLSQAGTRIITLILLSLLLTTVYVVTRQQLLVRRGRQISEQTVVTSASALGIVFFGMLVTWIGLLVVGLSVGLLLFQPDLIASWASSSGWEENEIGFSAVMQMSCFSAVTRATDRCARSKFRITKLFPPHHLRGRRGVTLQSTRPAEPKLEAFASSTWFHQ